MKKKIIGLAIVALMILSLGGLQSAEVAKECSKSENINRKITFVNNTDEFLSFIIFGFKQRGAGEGNDFRIDDNEIVHIAEEFEVLAKQSKDFPYCSLAGFYVKDVTGYEAEGDAARDFQELGFKGLDEVKGVVAVVGDDYYNPKNRKLSTVVMSRPRPLNLTNTFKKLQKKKSFNLVITINEVGKDPVVEIK